MQEHNKKVASKGKGSKASMGRLMSVFRRGTGAFSRSHAPNMSRSGWGIARVKAFLYLLRNGRPSNQTTNKTMTYSLEDTQEQRKHHRLLKNLNLFLIMLLKARNTKVVR